MRKRRRSEGDDKGDGNSVEKYSKGVGSKIMQKWVMKRLIGGIVNYYKWLIGIGSPRKCVIVRLFNVLFFCLKLWSISEWDGRQEVDWGRINKEEYNQYQSIWKMKDRVEEKEEESDIMENELIEIREYLSLNGL